MNYVLIWLVILGGAPQTPISQEFSSQQACEQQKTFIEKGLKSVDARAKSVAWCVAAEDHRTPYLNGCGGITFTPGSTTLYNNNATTEVPTH